jgi:hypothetical protein
VVIDRGKERTRKEEGDTREGSWLEGPILPPCPCFSEVRILRGLREHFRVSAESKGVITPVFSALTEGAVSIP